MKNRFTEEQIVKVLKEHEGGRPAADIVRELNRLSTVGSANTAT